MKRINSDIVLRTLYLIIAISMCVFVVSSVFAYISSVNKRLIDLENKIDILASDTDVRMSNLNLSIRQIESDIYDVKNDFTMYKDRMRKQLDELNEVVANYEQQQIEVEEVTEDTLEEGYIFEEVESEPEVQEEPKTALGGAVAIKTEHTYIEEIDDDPQVKIKPNPNPVPTGAHLTATGGVFNGPSGLETYYNMDMSVIVQVAHSNGIGGEYWIREDGCKMLGDYIMCACNRDVHPYGSLVQTSLGMGISLDTGGFAANNPTQIDIATNW